MYTRILISLLPVNNIINVFVCTLTGGYDYYRPSNVLIPAGVTNISFTVPIIDDNKTESNETFILTIKQSSLSNHLAYGRYGATTVTIIDDDCKLLSDVTLFCVYTYIRYKNNPHVCSFCFNGKK